MLKILLVDDATVDVMLTTIALEDCFIPHELSVARDGEEAYQILMNRPVDLLLLDIKMPKVSGFDLLKRLRDTSQATPPTIILSGSGLEADRIQARDLGVAQFIQKAVDFAAFKAELKEAVTKHVAC
jgi:two-component system response regulator